MRAHLPSSSPSSWLLLGSLPFIALGCFDRLGDDPQFDSGAIHFEAGTFDGSLPDGAAPDVTVDAPAEAGPRPVKVVVLKGGMPESGVNVVFQDANGAVVEAKTTGLDGSTSRVVDAGTMVTVALGGGSSRQLVTVLAVAPGDTLTALDDPPAASQSHRVSVDLPTGAPPTGTASYEAVSGPCSSPLSPSGPITYAVFDGDCTQARKFPVLVFAKDANGSLTGFSFKKGNAVDVDAGATLVTSLPPWAVGSGVTLTATNTGPTYTTIAYSEVADGVAYGVAENLMPSGGTLTASFRAYPGYADAVQLEAGNVTLQTGSMSAIRAIAKQAAPPATTQSIDLSQLLPAITNAVGDTTDITRPALTLTLAGAVVGADALVVQMSWSSAGDAGATDGQWIIVGPPTTTMVKAPAMPSGLAAWAPSAGASMRAPAAAIVDSDLLPGYDSFRTVFATFPPPGRFAPIGVAVPTLPSISTVRVSAFVQTPM